MYEPKIDQWHILQKTSEQLFKDLYIISFYEHISKTLVPDRAAGQGTELPSIF